MNKIVTIGGGTGSFTVLSGIKNIPNIEISAIVSMSDDGGSTGVLRDELGVLPPGDVRQCLVALSEHSDIVRALMSYRFEEGALLGHSFGNILLAALEKVSGSFVSGVEVASEILKIKGKVIPVTENKAELCIELDNGEILKGENKINHSDIEDSHNKIKKIFYKEKVYLNRHAKEAIEKADYIIIGPGNFYCSVVPNLIVDGFDEAIQNTKAKIIVPINLTNKKGHTLNWGAKRYAEELEKYLGKNIDFVLVNNKPASQEQIEKYKLQEGDGVIVKNDLDDQDSTISKDLLSTKIIESKVVDAIADMRSIIRHDSNKLAQEIINIIEK